MRSSIRHSLMLWMLASLQAGLSLAQETGITRQHHAWGRFDAGAWRRVRVVTESFDGGQTLKNTSEIKTTIKEVEEDGVTLLIETVVNVGGKEIRAEPQTVKQGWHGELSGEDVKITSLGTGEVTIQDRTIPCRIQQVEITRPADKIVTKIHYSDTVPPYILKRESVKTDPEGTTRLTETTVEVVDMGFQWRILANVNTFLIKAVHKHPKGSRTTVARISMNVPGEDVCRTTSEFDSSGHLIQRSQMDLLDYGRTLEEQRPGLFRRTRPGRLRRLHRFSPYRVNGPADEED